MTTEEYAVKRLREAARPVWKPALVSGTTIPFFYEWPLQTLVVVVAIVAFAWVVLLGIKAMLRYIPEDID